MELITLFAQLFVLALFLSVNNFIASIGMGFSRIWAQARWKIAAIFGLFDFIAPIVGLYLGNVAVRVFGTAVGMVGVLVIAMLGLYLMYDGWVKHSNQSSQNREHKSSTPYHAFIDKAVAGTWVVVVIALGISLDNFIVGFGLGTIQIPILIAAIAFGVVTFSMTFLGVFIGNKIRVETEEKIINFTGKGRIITGLVFISIALWKFFEIL